MINDEQRWLWKDVAGTFSVSNQMFQTQLNSLIVLRNFVAHHSRLWMRPTTVSPKLGVKRPLGSAAITIE